MIFKIYNTKLCEIYNTEIIYSSIQLLCNNIFNKLITYNIKFINN